MRSPSTEHCHLHAGTDSDDIYTDETSIEPKDVELVMLQVSRSTSKSMPRQRKMWKNISRFHVVHNWLRRSRNALDVE